MSPPLTTEAFLEELKLRARMTDEYILASAERLEFGPEHISKGVLSYIRGRGKRLRPAILLFSCGAAGGCESDALPAAAAVELFHTWTLVHDDIIDRDETRRGGPSVHTAARRWAENEWLYEGDQAAEYGRALAILTGDVQHAWAVSLFLECCTKGPTAAEVTARLLHEMESKTVRLLIEGETLDVQFSARSFQDITEADILRMQHLKTGKLLEFCARAGATLGRNTTTAAESEIVDRLAEFALNCGLAFQLQDDILGVTGNSSALGKPVGADIREGKKTIVALHALGRAKGPDREFLEQTLGNRSATPRELARASDLLVEHGGVEYASQIAQKYLDKARRCLEEIPESPYRALLSALAEYILRRNR